MRTENPRVKISKLIDRARMPTYSTEEAAGADLSATIEENVVIAPGERRLIPTGLQMELPPGFEAQVRPRSGLAIKSGITVLNSPGTIDADYRGEVKIILYNAGAEPFMVRDGDRIAQLVVAPVSKAFFETAETLSSSARAEGGFGSTGLR